ncbi:rhodanese-like domain-containing protein [Pontibacter sp. Tf4]|uniref:rhodanese-like domain-containing protein n=1 Tax=Pontibacter sp. Tf4 TaxID=2761620 RepID=UPI00162A3AC2|nr:rhodanese-like domain-containing protein [Pontibacter sp. Tf4]MBB6612577.1 rhodanese-like domain-containing protein [Pontibacter sp. Tf4]
MTKRILLLVALIAAAILLTDTGKHYAYSLLTSMVANQKVPTIEPGELQALEQPYMLLDIRTPAEYEISHLQGARFVNYNTSKLEDLADIPKDAKLILYCAVGARSANVGVKLLDVGYTDVHNLQGGIFNWVNKGFPVFDAGGRTSRIHPYSDFWGFWLTNGEKVYEP